MVKNIFNWTIGGFFRSLGRILCYIVVGVAIAYLIGSSDIKPKIKISDLLGIETIKADSYVNGHDLSYYFDSQMTQSLTNGVTYQYFSDTTALTYDENLKMKQLYVPIFNIDNVKGGHLTIPFTLDLPLVSQQISDTIYGSDYCSRWDCALWDTGTNNCRRFTCVEVNDSQTNTLRDYEYLQPQTTFNVYVSYSSGYVDNCQVDYDNNYFYCPIVNSNGLDVNGIVIAYKVFYGNNLSRNFKIGLGLKWNLWKNDTTSIIESQEQTTNSIDNQTQVIQDTNTTQEENATAEFFSQNHTSADGPLSSIVSAPLALIHNLTTGSSNPLCFTLKGKQSCLPSGQFIWGKTTRTGIDWFGGGALSSGISAFVALFNLVVGGFLAYKMVLSLFRIVEGLLNPKSTKVEVIKL